MARPKPKWRRRKEARPGEIVTAGLEVFAERGFAAARTDEIARRAGVSKGTLFLYFETKQDLFRAVVRQAVTPNLAMVEAAVDGADLPFSSSARVMLNVLTEVMTTTQLGSVAKVVIAESGNFPDLALIWHEDVVSRALGLAARLIQQAQDKSEVRPGDPRIHAFSLVGPILTGVLWREVFTPVGVAPFDLKAIAEQHIETALEGLIP